MNRELISIIVPCYNEEEMLPIFYEEIDKISKIIMVTTNAIKVIPFSVR